MPYVLGFGGLDRLRVLATAGREAAHLLHTRKTRLDCLDDLAHDFDFPFGGFDEDQLKIGCSGFVEGAPGL